MDVPTVSEKNIYITVSDIPAKLPAPFIFSYSSTILCLKALKFFQRGVIHFADNSGLARRFGFGVKISNSNQHDRSKNLPWRTRKCGDLSFVRRLFWVGKLLGSIHIVILYIYLPGKKQPCATLNEPHCSRALVLREFSLIKYY